MKTVSKVAEAEAHLYVAISKADGFISEQEFAQIPYYAIKSQRFFDVHKKNRDIAEVIGSEIQRIMSEIMYKSWDSDKHLDKAIELIKEAKSNGNWQGKVAFQKNENGFIESAKIDGYLFKESKFIKKMEKKLLEI